ncbi:YfaP family protein [Pseudomonas lini]|uniref:YfaP family protein n=1 Tax=Pseudomonas lini TaxID=163011 RepID=UPI00345EDF33
MKLRYPQVLLFLCSFCVWPTTFAADSAVKLDTPVGGWRTGAPEGEGENFRQTVNYPASSVNTPVGQANTARITGQINSTPKGNEPGKLIVNGVSMPLKIDPAGRYDRPFSFPNGSNSVEVRSPDGQQRHRTQFLNTSGGATPAKLRVLLAWDSDGTDIDLHLVTPDGGHIWYGDRVAANGGALDVDVTTGYGPEIFAMPAPIKGQYLVYVNYYGGGYRSDEDGQEEAVQPLTTAQITVITEEGTPNEKMETFLVPMRAVGELTLVKGFSYP